jgi:rhodanese-related sulfurtransferase
MAVTQLIPQQLKTKLDAEESLFLLDVREPAEFEYAHIYGSCLIPLNQIPQRLQEIDIDQDIVVICHHGIRSMQAANFLVQVGFKKVSNLVGGIEAWATECDPLMKRY